MAPRRGGGGGSISVSAEDDYNNPYYYDPDAYFSPSDINALCADLACSALLLAAALIIIPIILRKPWLNHTARRNKTRTNIFLAALFLVVIEGALNVAIDAIYLQGPNTLDDYEYYTGRRITIPICIVGLLDLVVIPFIFGLILVEITRRERHVNYKRTSFEIFGWVVIVVMVCLQFVLWIHGLMAYGFIPISSYPAYRDIILGLGITYRSITVLLAFCMLCVAPTKKQSIGTTKAQYNHIRHAVWTLWIIQCLSLVSYCFAWFLDSPRTFTVNLSLSATNSLLWIFVLYKLTMLARNSHSFYTQTGPIDITNGEAQHLDPTSNDAPPYQQPNVTYSGYTAVQNHGQHDPSWQKYPEVTTYTNATQHTRS